MGAPMEWRLADAKNLFSELVTRALAEGPQRVRRHDNAVVVVADQSGQGDVTDTFPRITIRCWDFSRPVLCGFQSVIARHSKHRSQITRE